jgi:hypothetical protein
VGVAERREVQVVVSVIAAGADSLSWFLGYSSCRAVSADLDVAWHYGCSDMMPRDSVVKSSPDGVEDAGHMGMAHEEASRNIAVEEEDNTSAAVG